ncbi:MAG: helicase [Polyangiaceae bacterium]|nr:helicase [Polyangiaceae bacterium]
MPASLVQPEPSICALLGPTNTGKTHRALERMLDHATGMIGLPLRLLAREVYDRLTAAVGEAPVALLTGEEKRVGSSPRYWVCTAEAMPMDFGVDFVAVDEIQLAAHPQRGHVFTERLLHARGRKETWFMGADTMRPMLQRLLPEARIIRHPRWSELRSRGHGALGDLPRRSALVAFSVPSVVSLAERVRRRRGGTAVVMGALSPRARNAQVALYQAGEVDYLVATDAIGMGLNLDLAHVAFAELRKFDGREERTLNTAELAQIAGRAGRYRNDGSFSTLSPAPELSSRAIRAIEAHRFEPVRRLVWRNAELERSSLDALIGSLRVRPPSPDFELVGRADDYEALVQLAAQPSIRDQVRSSEQVGLLWDVCQIPDYRQLTLDVHIRLLESLFTQLARPSGCLDPDWINKHVERLDNPAGDIDTLTTRMAFIRTWTYVAHHGRWLRDAEQWQNRTRGIEDRLSDALHERLVERFVERERRTPRGSVGPKPSERGNRPVREGFFAQLLELRQAMTPPPALGAQHGSVEELVDAPHGRFQVDARGQIRFGDRVIGVMTAGIDRLHPEVTLTGSDDVGAGARSRVQRRLVAWTRDLVNLLFAPLRHPDAAALSPAGRGLLYQLEQNLGTVLTGHARDQVASLSQKDRHLLVRLGVRLGHRLIYLPALLSPQALLERAALCAASSLGTACFELSDPTAASVPASGALRRDDYTALGYPVFGPRAIRADVAEAASQLLRRAARHGPFCVPAELARLLACPNDEALHVVRAFGYRPVGGGRFQRRRRRTHRGKAARS